MPRPLTRWVGLSGSRSAPDPRQTWSNGLPHELGFWHDWLASRGGQWPQEYTARLDPVRPFAQSLRDRLGPNPPETIHVLDVGAGPLTAIGPNWPGHHIVISAVDPLAADYNRMLDQAGITPLIRTQPCDAETLTRQFGRGCFDIVFCMNALDHSYDPLAGIRQMLAVVKPAGFVHLEHAENEAERQRHEGLHQWNFRAENGRFIIDGADRRIDVGAELGPEFDIACEPTPAWVTVTIRPVPVA